MANQQPESEATNVAGRVEKFVALIWHVTAEVVTLTMPPGRRRYNSARKLGHYLTAPVSDGE